jgi:hypothetical protein
MNSFKLNKLRQTSVPFLVSNIAVFEDRIVSVTVNLTPVSMTQPLASSSKLQLADVSVSMLLLANRAPSCLSPITG